MSNRKQASKRTTALKVFSLCLLAASLVGITFLSAASAAGNAFFTLRPTSEKQANGAEFRVSIFEDSGDDPVSTLEANLTYDASKLQYVGVDPSTSPFTESFGVSGGNGKVQMVRFLKGGVAGVKDEKLVAKVTFKALTSSGNTTIHMAPTSHILSSTSNVDLWNGVASSTTITFTSPPTTRPPTPLPTTSTTTTQQNTNSNNSSSGNSSNSSNSTTPSSPAQTESSASTTNKQKSSSNSTSPSGSTSASASENASNLTTISEGAQIGGGLVAVTVTGANGAAVSDATVTLDQNSAITDQTGVASFTGVVAGAYTVQVTSGKSFTTQDIVVKEGTNLQEFRISLNKKFSNAILIIPVLLVGILVAVVVLMKKRKSKKNGKSGSSAPMDGITVHSSSGSAPNAYDGSVTTQSATTEISQTTAYSETPSSLSSSTTAAGQVIAPREPNKQ